MPSLDKVDAFGDRHWLFAHNMTAKTNLTKRASRAQSINLRNDPYRLPFPHKLNKSQAGGDLRVEFKVDLGSSADFHFDSLLRKGEQFYLADTREDDGQEYVLKSNDELILLSEVKPSDLHAVSVAEALEWAAHTDILNDGGSGLIAPLLLAAARLLQKN